MMIAYSCNIAMVIWWMSERGRPANEHRERLFDPVATEMAMARRNDHIHAGGLPCAHYIEIEPQRESPLHRPAGGPPPPRFSSAGEERAPAPFVSSPAKRGGGPRRRASRGARLSTGYGVVEGARHDQSNGLPNQTST